MQSENIGFNGTTLLGPAMLGIDTVNLQQNRSNSNNMQLNFQAGLPGLSYLKGLKVLERIFCRTSCSNSTF